MIEKCLLRPGLTIDPASDSGAYPLLSTGHKPID